MMKNGSSTSQQPRPLWSYSPRVYTKPNTIFMLQSICKVEPLQSICLAPDVAAAPIQHGRAPRVQQQHHPETVLFRTADEQLGQLVQQLQQRQGTQQHQLQPLADLPDASRVLQSNGQLPQQSRQLDRQQQQQHEEQLAMPMPLVRLIAAARRQQLLPEDEKAELLRQLQPLLLLLPASQLAQGSSGSGNTAWRTVHCCQPNLATTADAGSEAAFRSWKAEGDSSSSAAASTGETGARRPDAAWMQAAFDSMQVERWTSPRSLSTVAACLPQLGHIPPASWAYKFLAASAAHLQAFPPISLARMLHGVVAWQHEQQLQLASGAQSKQPMRYEQQQQLQLPDEWTCRVLWALQACSSQLKPPEIAMVLQALQRLQEHHTQLLQLPSAQQRHPGFTGRNDPQTLLLQQASYPLHMAMQPLLHALIPAVTRQLEGFTGQDLAVVLQSLALMQQDSFSSQAHQRDQPHVVVLSSWSWLQRVLCTAQVLLPQCNARTQVTLLTVAATLMKPHVLGEQHAQQTAVQQELAKQQAAVQQQQTQHGPANQVDSVEAVLHRASLPALQQQSLRPRRARLVRPSRPLLQQQQQKLPSQQVTMQPGAAASAATATQGAFASANSNSLSGFWCQWMDGFFEASIQQLPHFSCEDLVLAACTIANQHHMPSPAWYEQLLVVIQQRAAAMSPGQVSGVAWALGRMALLPSRHNPSVSLVPLQPWMQGLYQHTRLPITPGDNAAVGPERDKCSAAVVIRLMWAAAMCEYNPGDTWWEAAEQHLLAYAVKAACSSDGNSRGHYTMSDSSSQRSSTHKEQGQAAAASWPLQTRVLSALPQAYAASGRQMPQQVLQQLLLAPSVCQQLAQEPVVNTVRLLRVLNKAGYSIPQCWLHTLAAAMQDRLGRLNAQELHQLLLSLAAAGVDLQVHSAVSAAASTTSSSTSSIPASWPGACIQACQHRLPQLTAQEACELLWSIAKLHMELPTQLLEALLQRVQAGSWDASPHALARCMDAVSQMGYAPSQDWMGGFYLATHRKFTAAADSMSSVNSRHALVSAILHSLWGLARLKAAPPARWLKQQLLLLHGQLPLLRPRHISALMLVLAKLRCRPSPAYLISVLRQLGDFSSCSAVELVHVLYAIGCLRWRPSLAWLRLLLVATAVQLPHMTPQGLALVHWALAVMRVVPPEPWKRAAVAAVAPRLGQLDALQLSMIAWAWGRFRVHLVPTPAQQQRDQQQQAVSNAVSGSTGLSDSSSCLYDQFLVPLSGSWPFPERQQVAQQLLAAAWRLRSQYSAGSLVHVLVGVAKMQLMPGQAWVHGMIMQGRFEMLSLLDGYQMQQLLWALAHLGYRPPRPWLQDTSLMLETKWQQNASTRHSAMWALQQLAVVANDGLPQGSAQQLELSAL